MFENILDVDSVMCRLCLEADGFMSGIFEDEAITGDGGTVCDNINLLSSIKVSPGDGLPTYICLTCKDKITEFVKFREQIECSYQILCQCIESKNIKRENVNIPATSTSADTTYDAADFDDYLDDERESERVNISTTKLNKKVKVNTPSSSDFIKQDIVAKNTRATASSTPDELITNMSYAERDKYIMNDCQIEIAPRITRLMYLDNDDLSSRLKVTTYLCHLCLMEFKNCSQQELEVHSLNHFGARQIEAVCQNDPVFNCEDCGEAFETRSAFVNHQRGMLCIKVFVCHICSRSYETKDKLDGHNRRAHSTAKGGTFTCLFCNETFDKAILMYRHRRKHMDGKPLICQICNRECVNLKALTNHLIRHKQGNQYCCEVCGKSFYTSAELERHEPSHTGVRKFPCQLCPKAFCSKSEIRRHLRYHFKIKRHECHICGKKYVESAMLKSHMNAHNNIRPFACDLCPSAFFNKNKLSRHMTNIHKIVRHKSEEQPMANVVQPKFTKLCNIATDGASNNPVSSILSYLPKEVVKNTYITVNRDGNILKDADGNILNMDEVQKHTANDGQIFYIVDEDANKS